MPSEVYEKYDLATIEDSLVKIMNEQSLGEFDGTEMTPKEAILFMYGPDAEALFKGIEDTLRDYPLCKGARVVIRSGPSGAPERQVNLA
ncbi:MAG: hypothetical protein ABI559_11095 [Chloroflexota bacterium]